MTQAFGGPTKYLVKTRALSPSGELGQIYTLSNSQKLTDLHRLAITTDAVAVFVWRRRLDAYTFRFEGRTLSADGNLAPVLTIYDGGTRSLAAAVGRKIVAIWDE